MSHDHEVLQVPTPGEGLRRRFYLNQNLNETPREFSGTRPRTGYGQASEAEKTCFGRGKLKKSVDVALQTLLLGYFCCNLVANLSGRVWQ